MSQTAQVTRTEDLLTSAQVASLANVEVSTLYTYRSQGRMPEPDLRIGTTLLWKRRTIERWMKTRRKPGRPKATKKGKS